MTTRNSTIAILGAGSIGCYIGGLLLNADCKICFIGREKTGQQITSHGLALTALDCDRVYLPGHDINWNTHAAAMAGCNTVLLCTKSSDTLASAKLIAKYCDGGTVVVSMQNGVGNTKILRENLEGMEILPAMVSFNVARIAQINEASLRFHRGTDGEIVFQQHQVTNELALLLSANGLAARTADDMEPVSWGKLLMNLNNAVNVISGLPLKRQLQDASYRRILALCVSEALSVMKAAGITPAKIGKVPPVLMPVILRLPDLIFNIVARSMLNIDDNARSSMWEDLQAGRQSEVDFLNGAICDLGKENKVATPVNDLMVVLVRELFSVKNANHLSANKVLDMIDNARNHRVEAN